MENSKIFVSSLLGGALLSAVSGCSNELSGLSEIEKFNGCAKNIPITSIRISSHSNLVFQGKPSIGADNLDTAFNYAYEEQYKISSFQDTEVRALHAYFYGSFGEKVGELTTYNNTLEEVIFPSAYEQYCDL